MRVSTASDALFNPWILPAHQVYTALQSHRACEGQEVEAHANQESHCVAAHSTLRNKWTGAKFLFGNTNGCGFAGSKLRPGLMCVLVANDKQSSPTWLGL